MTEKFPWGEVVKLHKIDGLPTVVEYKVGAAFDNPGAIQFNVSYKDGSSWGYATLDEAILGALCEKHKGGSALWHAIEVLFEHSELDHHHKLGSEDHESEL